MRERACLPRTRPRRSDRHLHGGMGWISFDSQAYVCDRGRIRIAGDRGIQPDEDGDKASSSAFLHGGHSDFPRAHKRHAFVCAFRLRVLTFLRQARNRLVRAFQASVAIAFHPIGSRVPTGKGKAPQARGSQSARQRPQSRATMLSSGRFTQGVSSGLSSPSFGFLMPRTEGAKPIASKSASDTSSPSRMNFLVALVSGTR